VVSGAGVSYRRMPGYKFGDMPIVTWQLGLTFEFDAQPSGQWRPLESGNILAAPADRTLSPRPIPKIDIKERVPAEIRTQGVFRRDDHPDKTVGHIVQSDFLSERRSRDVFVECTNLRMPSTKGITVKPECFASGGVYLLIDMHREEVGFLDLDLETNAGAIVDIGWGEHLDDCRVRAYVDQRNFATRYVCKDGRQTFTHPFMRLAGRYLELHITGVTDKFTLYYAGLKPTEYPVVTRGKFQSPDQLQNKIFQTAVRTLHLCMHEHYEDCPWREQALYANDGRNQALAGYHAFGEYAFPAESFSLLARTAKDDGYMEMCAPAVIDRTIPSFSIVWFLAVQDHWMHSGDMRFVRKMMPYIKKMMAVHLSRMKDGLLPCPAGKRYWHFYDWAEGLASWDREVKSGDVRFDAPLNLFFCLALDASAKLAEACGESDFAKAYTSAAQQIRSRFHPLFWNAGQSAYATYRGVVGDDHFAELTQSLAILSGAAPADIASQLKDRLVRDANGLVETTLSQSLYKFEAVLTDKQKYGRWVFDKIARDWGNMLYNGATSFWETLNGGWDFDNAGSLCHGWSATPIYFYHAYLLGVKPVEPGFKTFTIDPVKDVIPCVAGEVPTPFGPIKLKWEKAGEKTLYTLSHPNAISPDILHFTQREELRIVE